MRSQLAVFRDEKPAAIAALRRAFALDPEQHERLLEIGRLQAESGALGEALST